MPAPSRSFGAIILAAGASERLGYPKQTILFCGETLLDRAVGAARTAGACEVVVVLGAHASEIRDACKLKDCTVVENEVWNNGLGTSIRCGVQALRDVEGTLLLTCDMPAVTAEHLRALAETGTATASRYGNKNGVPAYFPQMTFTSLTVLEDSEGASRLLWGATVLPLPGGEFDVDTAADVEALNRWRAPSS
jgi:molybdenum cofactor cytidylyltransferase